jgi:hypothetical protein
LNKILTKIKVQIKRNRVKTDTHVRDSSLSWLGSGTSIKSDEVKLALWLQASLHNELMWSEGTTYPFGAYEFTLVLVGCALLNL